MTKTKLILSIEDKISEDLKKFLLREYSQKGKTLVEVSTKLGISRSSLANFMRMFNIKIRKSNIISYGDRKLPTKEELIDLYSKKNITAEEIGKIFGFTKSTICKFLKKNGIPILTHKEKLGDKWSLKYDKCIKCGRTSVKFVGKGLCATCSGYKRLGRELIKRVDNINDDEEQVIYGSLLGDASISKTPLNALFVETHCLKQKDYLFWKKMILIRFNPKVSSKNNNEIRLWTEVSPVFKKLREKFYPNGKKIVTKEILSRLKPLGLAVWFMDDGSLNLRAGGDISTDCFTKKENILIKNYLDDLGVFCKVFKRKSGTYKIIINAEGFRNLVEIIKPYIHPTMIYKIDENRRRKYRKTLPIAKQ